MNWHDIFDYADGHIYTKDGELAEIPHSAGYLQVNVAGQLYLVHRVIYEMHNGVIPIGMVIDHDDRDKSNNYPNNLKITTYGGNSRNKKKHSNNSSGVTGVSWESGRSKWRAHIEFQGKAINLGRYTDINDAIAIRLQVEHDLGFHPNHGK